MPLYSFGIGGKCLGVIEKESIQAANEFINCSDPESWISEFTFICSPKGLGNRVYTFVNFGNFTSAYDFADHLEKTLRVEVSNEDDNLLRLNGYYLYHRVLKALLKTPFISPK